MAHVSDGFYLDSHRHDMEDEIVCDQYYLPYFHRRQFSEPKQKPSANQPALKLLEYFF